MKNNFPLPIKCSSNYSSSTITHTVGMFDFNITDILKIKENFVSWTFKITNKKVSN